MRACETLSRKPRSDAHPNSVAEPRLEDLNSGSRTGCASSIRASDTTPLAYAEHVPILVLLLVAVLAVIALIPISIVQRYRLGTARRPARGWVATANLVALTFSAVLVLVSAALTNVWVPEALRYTTAGLAGGALLGIVGTWLTRWEATPQALQYTPPRLLVLLVTSIVTARILFGFWRAWRAWDAGFDRPAWVVGGEVAGTMGAGAIVLGYYLAYWFGVRARLKRYRRSLGVPAPPR